MQVLSKWKGKGEGGEKGWGVGSKGRNETQERTMSATISDHLEC